MVLLAGMRMSRGKRRSRSSRIFLAPQWRFSLLMATMRTSSWDWTEQEGFPSHDLNEVLTSPPNRGKSKMMFVYRGCPYYQLIAEVALLD